MKHTSKIILNRFFITSFAILLAIGLSAFIYITVFAVDTDGDGLSDDVDNFPNAPILTPTINQSGPDESGVMSFWGTGEVGTQIRVYDNNDAELCQADVLGNGVLTGDGTQSTIDGNDLVLGNITAQFFYDTTAEAEDAWRVDNTASWYAEAKDDLNDEICDYQVGDGDGDPRGGADDRCGENAFPKKALIISTADTVFIFDADLKTLWMKFSVDADLAIRDEAGAGSVSSLFMIDGILLAGNAASYLSKVDFGNDGAVWFQDTGVFQKSGDISQRNISTSSSQIAPLSLLSGVIYNIFVREVNEKLYIAVATEDGVNIINDADSSILDLTEDLASYVPQKVQISEEGTLYIAAEDTDFLGIATHYNIDTLTTQNIWGGADVTYTEDNLQNPNVVDSPVFGDFEEVSGGSIVNSTNNLLVIGTGNGVNLLHEHQSDETNGGVRNVTKDYATLPMIGDIRGHWSDNTFTDRSERGNTLTNVTAVSLSPVATGAELQQFSFDGTHYLESASADFNITGTNLTVGAWIKRPTTGGNGPYQKIISHGETDENYFLSAGENFFDYPIEFDPYFFAVKTENGIKAASVQTAPVADTWEFIVGTYNGSEIQIYRNGVLEQSIPHTGNITDLNEKLFLGKGMTNQEFTGNLALPFISAKSYSEDLIGEIYNRSSNWFADNATITLFGTSDIVQDIDCDTNREICLISTENAITQIDLPTGLTTEIISSTNTPIITDTRIGEWSCTSSVPLDPDFYVYARGFVENNPSNVYSDARGEPNIDIDGGSEVAIAVEEALVLTIDDSNIVLNVDPSVNDGQDFSNATTLTVSTNSDTYSIYAEIDGELSYTSPEGTTSTIANSTGENAFGYSLSGTGPAETGFSETPTILFEDQAGLTNEATHTVNYSLDVDYLTEAGVYGGVITYTAMPSF